MPTYEYVCSNGHEFERSLPVAQYQDPQTCECGRTGKRVISAPLLAVVQRECRYDSPIDGRPITSWRAREEDLKRHGCQEYDPAMRQDYHRRLEREDAQLEKSIESTVEAEIERMPARKRERLQNELNAGAHAAPVRGAAPLKTTRSISK